MLPPKISCICDWPSLVTFSEISPGYVSFCLLSTSDRTDTDALDLSLTGKNVRADKAKRLGLVDLLVEPLGKWGDGGMEGGVSEVRDATYIFSLYTKQCICTSPVHLVCDAWVEVLWLLCIVYVIRAQPAELPR